MEDEVSSESEDIDAENEVDGDRNSESDRMPTEKKKEHKTSDGGNSRRTKRRRKSSLSPEKYDESGKPCCVCRRPPSNKMIKCGNSVCKTGLFHVSCMRLFKGMPTLKWYCMKCRRYQSKSNIIKPEFKKVNGL